MITDKVALQLSAVFIRLNFHSELSCYLSADMSIDSIHQHIALCHVFAAS